MITIAVGVMERRALPCANGQPEFMKHSPARFLSDYGMIFVLLLLCAFFSVVTYSEQYARRIRFLDHGDDRLGIARAQHDRAHLFHDEILDLIALLRHVHVAADDDRLVAASKLTIPPRMI